MITRINSIAIATSLLNLKVEETTDWRRVLCDSILERLHYPDDINVELIKRFLSVSVTWERQVKDAAIYIFHKRQQ